jgi:hypothetical protein
MDTDLEMKCNRLTKHLLFALVTFSIGVAAVWTRIFVSGSIASVISIGDRTTGSWSSNVVLPVDDPASRADAQAIPEPQSNDFPYLTSYAFCLDYFECRVAALKLLPGFMGKSGRQTFYLSKPVRGDDRDYAFAYWKEDHSIIIFNLPLTGEINQEDLWWLSLKGRVDLKKDVVPKMLGNMGCCLVTKAWAEQRLKWCKSGYKLEVSEAKNIAQGGHAAITGSVGAARRRVQRNR